VIVAGFRQIQLAQNAAHMLLNGALGNPKPMRDTGIRMKLFPSDSAVLESKRWSRPEKRHDGGSFA
jgi:hypothetical protein